MNKKKSFPYLYLVFVTLIPIAFSICYYYFKNNTLGIFVPMIVFLLPMLVYVCAINLISPNTVVNLIRIVYYI